MIAVAATLSWFLHQSEHILVIELEFLEVGHSRLECDGDHARIERAQKGLSEVEIKVPQDWYKFVPTVRNKKKFRLLSNKKKNSYHILLP